MGASLTMIDGHYGHLAKDGREHAIDPLDAHNVHDVHDVHDVHAVGARWTRENGSHTSTPSRNRP